jgi:hypothetical protein
MLIKAYWMELETVTNYLANSVNLDGVRAEKSRKVSQSTWPRRFFMRRRSPNALRK